MDITAHVISWALTQTKRPAEATAKEMDHLPSPVAQTEWATTSPWVLLEEGHICEKRGLRGSLSGSSRICWAAACWEGDEFAYLWCFKNIWRSSVRALIWTWGDRQGVEELRHWLLQAHALLTSVLVLSPSLPLVMQSVFSCSFCACLIIFILLLVFVAVPIPLNFYEGSFPLYFQKVLICSSLPCSSSCWTKKMSRKRKVNSTFPNFWKLLFERREKVQVSSYFYLNSFPIQRVSIRNVKRFRGI